MNGGRDSERLGLRVAVCGLGYVGAVTAACLARLGHTVTGVDIQQAKVDAINAGRSPFIEKGLSELIAEMVMLGRLSATTDATAAVQRSQISLVCVGTPSREDGSLNTDFVHAICAQIAEALRESRSYHVVVVRSTLLPGIARAQLVPALEKTSGKAAGVDFGICLNPEFLREGSAIDDFFQPSRTVIGEFDQRSGDVLAAMYAGIPGPVIRTSFETAEVVKYCDNWWHALKIAFANEVGTLANAVGVDSRTATNIFMLDTKLNISAAYLKPGLAFGGSCLPKDLRALNHLARLCNVKLPLLEAVLPSNAEHLARALEAIRAANAERIGFLGMTFKPGTDDVRESPAVQLIAALVRDGRKVLVHDDNVDMANIVGSNSAFLRQSIPSFPDQLVDDPEALCRGVEVLVLIHDTPKYRALVEQHRGRLSIVDCARLEQARPICTPVSNAS